MKYIKFYLPLIVVLFSSTASALEYASVLLDTTASMNKKRGDGQTRCELAFQITENSINEFFDLRGGKLINVYTFGASGDLKSVTGGFVNKTIALSKFRALNQECPGNSTALAESICKTTDQLRSFATSRKTNDIALVVATDGKELSSKQCGGRNKVSDDFEVSKQWHKSVYAKIMNSNPKVPFIAMLFWPDANEIPDDFYFMKYLAIVSHGESYGGASKSGQKLKKMSPSVSHSQVFADDEVFTPGSIWIKQ